MDLQHVSITIAKKGNALKQILNAEYVTQQINLMEVSIENAPHVSIGIAKELIDKAFSIRNPLIQINDLSTETKESEHKGFANLIKGVFGMFRNTTAHSPRIIWDINENDALDILSTISLIHRRLNINE